MIGETTDIGLVTLRCAPAIEIKNSASRTPLPSATLLRGEARARRLVVGQPPTDLRELFEVAGEDYLRLTGFEEGRSLVEARFRHPLLSPEGVALSEEVTMQRGHVVSLTLSTPRFLGAIDYAGDARALRVRHEDSGAVVLQPVEDGLAIVPSLEPGSYRVELCADGECTRSRALDDALLVEEGRFTELGR